VVRIEGFGSKHKLHTSMPVFALLSLFLKKFWTGSKGVCDASVLLSKYDYYEIEIYGTIIPDQKNF